MESKIHKLVNVTVVCNKVGMTRQNYYAKHKRRHKELTCPPKLEECRRKSVGGSVKIDSYQTTVNQQPIT